MLIALFLTLTACKNDCQSICVELNAFAEEFDRVIAFDWVVYLAR